MDMQKMKRIRYLLYDNCKPSSKLIKCLYISFKDNKKMFNLYKKVIRSRQRFCIKSRGTTLKEI